MENILAIIGFGILIGSCIRIFKFIRHKLWLYLPLFLIGGILISIGFAWMFGASAGWAGGMAWGFAGLIAIAYQSYLENKNKKKKEPKFKINKHKRLVIILIGFIVLSIGGTLYLIYSPVNEEDYPIVDELLKSQEYLFVGLEESEIPYQIQLDVSSSGINLDVYILPKASDRMVFQRNPKFNAYQNCYQELKSKISFSCNITGGGIIVSNPTNSDGFFSLDVKDNGYVKNQNSVRTIEAYGSIK